MRCSRSVQQLAPCRCKVAEKRVFFSRLKAAEGWDRLKVGQTRLYFAFSSGSKVGEIVESRNFECRFLSLSLSKPCHGYHRPNEQSFHPQKVSVKNRRDQVHVGLYDDFLPVGKRVKRRNIGEKRRAWRGGGGE